MGITLDELGDFLERWRQFNLNQEDAITAFATTWKTLVDAKPTIEHERIVWSGLAIGNQLEMKLDEGLESFPTPSDTRPRYSD